MREMWIRLKEGERGTLGCFFFLSCEWVGERVEEELHVVVFCHTHVHIVCTVLRAPAQNEMVIGIDHDSSQIALPPLTEEGALVSM
jgi:hypothetical protein